jgi:hypothetical protein
MQENEPLTRASTVESDFHAASRSSEREYVIGISDIWNTIMPILKCNQNKVEYISVQVYV